MLAAHMLEFIDQFLSDASSFLWGYILLFCLLGTHLYLTVVLRVPQRYFFKALRYYFHRPAEGNGHISHFSSLMVSLAANVGTGNIVGVPKDAAEAVKWYRAAAEQGYAQAQYNLGVCYYNGEGVKRDRQEAKKWLRKAADGGDEYAKRILKQYY